MPCSKTPLCLDNACLGPEAAFIGVGWSFFAGTALLSILATLSSRRPEPAPWPAPNLADPHRHGPFAADVRRLTRGSLIRIFVSTRWICRQGAPDSDENQHWQCSFHAGRSLCVTRPDALRIRGCLTEMIKKTLRSTGNWWAEAGNRISFWISARCRIQLLPI